MAGRGHPIQGREYPRALRGDSFRGLVKHPLFWCAVVGSMVVAVNIILLRKYHHVKKPSPIVTVGTMGTAHDVSKYGVGESGFYKTTDRPRGERNPGLVAPGALVIPPAWDSTLCMEHWERPELLTEPDPNGYVVFVNGAEQLGGNKYLFADGIFIAKMLDRTLVEFPVKDARISAANSTIGLGAYWDLLDMCMTHRILDILSFRRLVEKGSLTADDFVTINTHRQQSTTHHFRRRNDVSDFFRAQLQYQWICAMESIGGNYYPRYGMRADSSLPSVFTVQVIVLEGTWKSNIHRHSLMYLSPNPFFLGVSRMLTIKQEGFRHGEFIAVQWRTETATGNMSACYDEVRAVIEEHRIDLGYTRDQVLFSTDMFGSTSGTYASKKKKDVGEEAIRRIREDYPKALDNRLHEFFNEIEDSGVRAIVSGLVVAQARMLLASSLNKPELKATPEACVCQKPFSGYIHLITDWRTRLLNKIPETVVRLFPYGEFEREEAFVTSTDSSAPKTRQLTVEGETNESEGAEHDHWDVGA